MFFDWRSRDAAGTVPELARILRRPGAVAVVPTETVYGLVGRASDPLCRERIYALKHRDGAKPLGRFFSSPEELEKYGIVLNAPARKLVRDFMPGPLTVIAACSGGGTAGFRIPEHPLLLALLRELGEPLFQTSANRSGSPNALTCAEACAVLAGTPDAVADGGPVSPHALASTVVDCSGAVPRILRRGALDLEDFLNDAKQGGYHE
ncbi:MAG: L-threonylcarbamoyladenylate synthase [Lentisphaeria bacterium]|nr:L-threonylcarbamoyladenylate synthase [Lentisphaeria bacterium]